MSQDGTNEEEKGGGTEEVANEMASLGIVEVSKLNTTTVITNKRGERLNESPPYKTGRGNQKEGLGSKTRMVNQEEGNKVRADSKPHANNDKQDGKEKGEGKAKGGKSTSSSSKWGVSSA